MSALLQTRLDAIKGDEQFNRFEAALAQFPQVVLPVRHAFTPGLYIRTIFMPAGAIVTSKIHRTEHPFVISKGSVTVIDAEGNRTLLTAPHMGITQPGTRRALHVHEDCIWATFHPTDKTTVEEVERDIIEPHDIPPTADGVSCFDKGEIVYFSPQLHKELPC